MKREHHTIGQNSPEWFALRLGRFTASTFADLFMGRSTAGYKKAIYRPVYERIAGESPEFFSSDAMARGTELEPVAAEAYQARTFAPVSAAGFWTMGDWVGASPDRLVSETGLLEIKCPLYSTQMDYLLKPEVPKTYLWQIHGQMYLTGRDWCDFYSYHPKLDALLLRVHRDEKKEMELIKQLSLAVEQAEEIISKLRKTA